MSRRLALFLFILFAIRAAAALYAFDRRPVITSTDEIYWAEPAWALLHGKGYTLPCCEGMLFGDFYPQHPPVYVLILAGSFKVFGFTPAALRLPSILAHLVSVALMLVLLWRLRRLRVLDQWGFIAAAVLVLCDFSSLSLARAGRPDPWTVLFSLLGFLTLLCGSMKSVPLRRRAWMASIFLGLAMSTHTIAVFYLALFALVLFSLRRRLGWYWCAYPLVSCAVFAAFWIAIFGERSIEALQGHRELANQMGGASRPPYRSLQILTGAINQTEFLQAGGTTAVVILATFFLFCARIVSDPSVITRRFYAWRLLAIALAIQLAMIMALTSLGITRCYIYFPFSVIVVGVVVTRCRPNLRRVALAFVGIVAVMEIGQAAYVLEGTHRDYDRRSPHRHDALMDRLAQHRRVAVIPPLWFQARSRGLDFRLVDLSVPMQDQEWRKKLPNPFADFDAVVLQGDHSLLDSPDLAGIKPEDFPEVGPWGLILYELKPPK